MTLNRRSTKSAMLFGLELGVLLLAGTGLCLGQALPPVRGVYTPGFNATNSGVIPEPGLTYGNSFMDYSFNQFRSASGAVVAQNNAAVFIDINAFEWVAKKKILGANYAVAALLPFSNSSISSPTLGAIAGGGGFSDSFYQPLTLGWHFKRADIQAAYGFFAPTGRFTAGATTNTGTGHWTNSPTAGETFYLTKNKRTSVSAYQLYEFPTLLQFGLVGYGQWQTSNNSGPGVNPAQPHYKVNALGGAASVILPARKASVGFKLFKEFSNSSTVQGYSLQIVGGITF